MCVALSQASMADERDRAGKLVGVQGAKEEQLKLARNAADSARLELRNTVATIAAMSKDRESFAASMRVLTPVSLSVLVLTVDIHRQLGYSSADLG